MKVPVARHGRNVPSLEPAKMSPNATTYQPDLSSVKSKQTQMLIMRAMSAVHSRL